MINFTFQHDFPNTHNYSRTSAGISSSSATCDDLTKQGATASIQLQTTGQELSMTYDKSSLYQKVNSLLNKKYEEFIVANEDDKIYFSDVVDFNDFLRGVSYVIDKQGVVYIGGLNKTECKRITYSVPNDLKATVVNKNGVCTNRAIIKFQPNT